MYVTKRFALFCEILALIRESFALIPKSYAFIRQMFIVSSRKVRVFRVKY